MRRPAIAAALALLLCVAPTSAAEPSSATTQLRAIEAQVADIRGLAPLSEPDLRLLDQTSLKTFLEDDFTRNYLPAEREADQQELVALGLLQPTDNLVQIQLNLFNDQVVGVYDPDLKSMFVLSDQPDFGPAVRVTYAHEFNHALQDQHYELNRIAPKHNNNSDRSMAVHALLEGDAVLLQTLWAKRYLSEREVAQLLQASGSDAGLAEAPLIVRAELLFPYTEGLNFVRQTYRRAGNTYAAVDDLFANPPESTSQVLHPERYREHVHPVEVTLPPLAANLGADWRTVGDGVLGELDTRVLLEQWGTRPGEAARIASGWAGDHWQLVEADGHSAMVVRSAWTADAAASDFYAAHTRGLRTRFPDATVDGYGPSEEALTATGSVTDVRVDGTEVLSVIASDRATADAVAGVLMTRSLP